MVARAKNRKILKGHLLLGHWPSFKIILQEGSLGDPLPKLLQPFRSAEHDSRELKPKKPLNIFSTVNNLLKRYLLLNQLTDFEIILKECSLGDPLPKLPKLFCSAEQKVRQS